MSVYTSRGIDRTYLEELGYPSNEKWPAISKRGAWIELLEVSNLVVPGQ